MSDMVREIHRYLDNDLSDDEVAALFEWVGANSANADLFAHQTLLDQHTDELLVDGAVQMHADPEARMRPVRRRRTMWILATLTTIAVLIVAILQQGQEWDVVSSEAAVATLGYESHARWSDQDRQEGELIGVGVLELDAGIVRLDFRNGATVTLQGPARFEIISGNSTRLDNGILTASIPESAVGFEVTTPAIDVVDLGTAFGVSVGADGETDVCVFEGEVEVSLPGSEGARSPQLVREGNAVRSRPTMGSIESVAYMTGRYEDAWPVTSGVLQATGLMKFVSPGPDFMPGRYEDSERILVFPERFGVTLNSDVSVDFVEPGQYRRVHRQAQEVLAAGLRVNSYLLQLDPIGELKRKSTNKPRVIGQITFDRPVLGLIAVSARLNATDELLGHPLGDYGNTPRGIEPSRTEDSTESGRDVVILSADRRTLSLDLSAGSAVDQIRVVVDASPSE